MNDEEDLPFAAPIQRPLTANELAEWFGCTRRFLELEVNAGRLRKTTFGRNRIRFLPSDIRAWLTNPRPAVRPKKVNRRAAPKSVKSERATSK
jgi:hypothetical protein